MKIVTAYIDDLGKAHMNERDARKADARIYLAKQIGAATSQGETFPDEFIEKLEKDQVVARRHMQALFNIEPA